MTALIFSIPEADAILEPWRLRHAREGPRGMPAHITVLYPFAAAALARRWSILLGLLAWIDWGAALFTRQRQRLLDLIAHTLIADDPERVTASDRSLSMP